MRPLFAPLALALLISACNDDTPLDSARLRLPDGGLYQGTVRDGVLQGEGRIDYPNGAYVSGHFDKGQAEGPGEWHSGLGDNYRGGFHLGQFHGKGILEYRSGMRYEGDFVLGRMEGQGQLIQDGSTYRGDFRADLFDGNGAIEWPDGSHYEGEFHANQPEGEGVRTAADGSRASGHFRQGQLEGKGVYESADGIRYEGTFEQGLLNGEGTYESEDGTRYEGQFTEGRFNGPGRYENAEGDLWQGHFEHGELNGEGTFTGSDGSHYAGRFVDWRAEGKGTLRLADGTVQTGHWLNGERILDEQGRRLPAPLELGLLAQGDLLKAALDAVPASTPATELYTLTLAGDGEQSVFLREADYVGGLLARRFGTHGQITLANHHDHLQDRPLATRENLDQALRTLAERSGPEDIVFIYLTSHGSDDHQLLLRQPGLQLASLSAPELAAMLEPLKERRKIVTISACFSGGFMPSLKDENTLVMTAARADRVSFGCSEESDFTYFGRALFADALSHTNDLKDAFHEASTLIAEREKADGFEASEPQIWAPQAVLAAWAKLPGRPEDDAPPR